MNKELYVSSTPHETKVALVEDDQLAEVFYERGNEYTLAGSIYKGHVTRVLPGMQSAFVDIGLARDAFLYVSDFLEVTDEEESDEFGEIPAPATAVNLSRQVQSAEASAAVETPADEQAEFVDVAESVSSDESKGESEGRESTAVSEETRPSDGARRWRGRRRRGGRRGARDDRYSRPEQPRAEAREPKEAVPTSEPVTEPSDPAALCADRAARRVDLQVPQHNSAGGRS